MSDFESLYNLHGWGEYDPLIDEPISLENNNSNIDGEKDHNNHNNKNNKIVHEEEDVKSNDECKNEDDENKSTNEIKSSSQSLNHDFNVLSKYKKDGFEFLDLNRAIEKVDVKDKVKEEMNYRRPSYVRQYLGGGETNSFDAMQTMINIENAEMADYGIPDIQKFIIEEKKKFNL